MTFENNIKSIDVILNNLYNEYKFIKTKYELEGGGSKKNSPYYKKYKDLIKNSINTINYYKGFALQQMNNNVHMNMYFQNMIGILQNQKDNILKRSSDSNKLSISSNSKYNMDELQKLQLETKNNQEKINMLKIMISGLEKIVQNKELKGGDISPNDFVALIPEQIGLVDSQLKNINESNQTLEADIKELTERYEKIMNNDFLFKKLKEVYLQASEQLANPTTSIVDLESTYIAITEKLGQVNSMAVINSEMARYINDLKNYATRLETIIEENKKLISATASQAGGTLEPKTYIQAKKAIEDTHTTEIKNQVLSLQLPNIDLSPPKEALLENKELKDMPNKLKIIIDRLTRLNNKVKEYRDLYNKITTNNTKTDIFVNTDKNNIITRWNETFNNRKTNFYKELLDRQIYFYNGKTKFSDALKNIVTSNIKIKIEYTLVNDLINTLDDSIIVFDNFNFFIQHLIYMTLLFTNPDAAERYNKEYNKRMYSLEKYIDMGKPIDSIVVPPEQIALLDINMIADISKRFTTMYNESVNSTSTSLVSEKIRNKSNISIINKIRSLSGMIKDLYVMVCAKLGKKLDTLPVSGNQDITKFSEFLAYIKTLETEQPQLGGGISKPRLDPYKKQLNECMNKLLPFVKTLSILNNLLHNKKYQLGDLGEFSETTALMDVFNSLAIQVNNGINSYIKVIPMIFFTVEFPPIVYAKTECKYTLSFDEKTREVTYKLIHTDANEMDQKCKCNKLGLKGFTNEDWRSTFKSHAAFLAYNNMNGTKKIIDDPIIGLGNLIKTGSEYNKPINKTINMMFALGASGTGKTSRYFGIPGANNVDDRGGLVTYVIENAKGNVSLAYFVCYGQKNKKDYGFNEMVLFFDIDKTKNSSASVDDKYIPYIMKKEAKVTTNSFTEFFSTVVSKKLLQTNFSTVQQFVSNGGEFPSNEPSGPGKTFRQVLEQDNIWKPITKDLNISEIFEGLIKEQKKIHTVLPTKNNIESSRGHTCVLIKMEDTSGSVKYFPLFDMAGTENTKGVSDFLIDGRNPEKMAKLVLKVNEITQSEGIITGNKDTNGKDINFPSLNDMVERTEIREYIQAGGMDVDTFKTKLPKDSEPGPGINFLNKIVNEGYYINHTIGMLMFIALCIGATINSEKDGKNDKFDFIEDAVFTKLKEFTCIPQLVSDFNCDKTLLMIDEYDFNSILNRSCIWAQVLFSFLYWNEETVDSSAELLKNNSGMVQENPSYLYDLKKQQLGNTSIDMKDIAMYKEIPSLLADMESRVIAINKLKPIEYTYNNLTYVPKGQPTKIRTSVPLDKLLLHNFTKIDMNLSSDIEVIGESELTELQTLADSAGIIMKFVNTKINNNQSKTELITDPDFVETGKQSIKWPKGTDAKSLPLTTPGLIQTILEENKHIKNNALFTTKLQAIIKIDEDNIAFGDANNIKPNSLKDFVEKMNIKLKSNSLPTFDLQDSVLQNDAAGYGKTLLAYNTELNELIKFYKDNRESIVNFIEDCKPNGKYEALKLFLNKLGCGLKLENGKLVLDCTTHKLDELINFITTYVANIPEFNNNTEAKNQMRRIMDGRISATKMVLMHLITGLGLKHFMVKEVIGLINRLYEATDIKLTADESANKPITLAEQTSLAKTITIESVLAQQAVQPGSSLSEKDAKKAAEELAKQKAADETANKPITLAEQTLSTKTITTESVLAQQAAQPGSSLSEKDAKELARLKAAEDLARLKAAEGKTKKNSRSEITGNPQSFLSNIEASEAAKRPLGLKYLTQLNNKDNDKYQTKYLKYKQKYLKLKNKQNL